jgi:hypothetical protein
MKSKREVFSLLPLTESIEPLVGGCLRGKAVIDVTLRASEVAVMVSGGENRSVVPPV